MVRGGCALYRIDVYSVCFVSVVEWTNGADVSPPATTIGFSALLSLTDLEESSEISGCKEWWYEEGNCLHYCHRPLKWICGYMSVCT